MNKTLSEYMDEKYLDMQPTVEAVPKKDIDNAIDRLEELMLCYRDAGLTGEVIGMKVALEILKRGKDRNA